MNLIHCHDENRDDRDDRGGGGGRRAQGLQFLLDTNEENKHIFIRIFRYYSVHTG